MESRPYETGPRGDRLQHFDRLLIRCDGNNRTCTNKAADEYTLNHADGFGNKTSDELVIRRSCGRHRAQFMSNGQWILVSVKRLGTAGRPGEERRVA